MRADCGPHAQTYTRPPRRRGDHRSTGRQCMPPLGVCVWIRSSRRLPILSSLRRLQLEASACTQPDSHPHHPPRPGGLPALVTPLKGRPCEPSAVADTRSGNAAPRTETRQGPTFLSGTAHKASPGDGARPADAGRGPPTRPAQHPRWDCAPKQPIVVTKAVEPPTAAPAKPKT